MSNEETQGPGDCVLFANVNTEENTANFNDNEASLWTQQSGEAITCHGKILDVLKYFKYLDEAGIIIESKCQVFWSARWIHEVLEKVLAPLKISSDMNLFFGPTDLNFHEIEEFERDIQNVLIDFPPKDARKNRENFSSRPSIFKIRKICLNEQLLYAAVLKNYFKFDKTDLWSKHNWQSTEEIKKFAERMNRVMDFIKQAPKAKSDVVEIDENVWFYIMKENSDLISKILTEYGCSLTALKTPEGKYQVKLSSKIGANVETGMDFIIDLYQKCCDKGISTKTLYLQNPVEFDLLNELVDKKKMYGNCCYTVCGQREEVEDLERIFKSEKDTKRIVKTTRGNSKKADSPENEVRATHIFPSGLRMFISKGNLIHQRTDAIVNPANSRLVHGGGAARAIADAAGKELESECKEYIKMRKELPLSEVMHTTAGNMRPNVRYVIHTVGPQVKGELKIASYQNLIHQQLKKAFYNCLKYANDELKIPSVAVPAISSGIYGVPMGIVTSAMFRATEEFIEQNKRVKTNLKEIHFVNFDEATVDKIEKAYVEWFKVGSSVYKNTAQNGSRHSNSNDITEVDENLDSLKNKNKENAGNSQEVPMDVDDNQVNQNKRETKSDNEDEEPIKTFPSSYRKKRDDNESTDKAGIQNKQQPSTDTSSKKSECVICMDKIKNPTKLKCGHEFCKDCLEQYDQKCQPKCPSCGMIYGKLRGNQPPGQMDVNMKNYPSLSGYNDCGTIEINYCFLNGTQSENHPNPGKPYKGTTRRAYLPNNKEGKEVAQMFRNAFNDGLLFTIDRSHTTGRDDVVVWNDIHHKTSIVGQYGYPDPGYLKRVKEELASKGIYPHSRSGS